MHERDPRHRRSGPVVEEDREPAALVLLRGDQPVGQAERARPRAPAPRRSRRAFSTAREAKSASIVARMRSERRKRLRPLELEHRPIGSPRTASGTRMHVSGSRALRRLPRLPRASLTSSASKSRSASSPSARGSRPARASRRTTAIESTSDSRKLACACSPSSTSRGAGALRRSGRRRRLRRRRPRSTSPTAASARVVNCEPDRARDRAEDGRDDEGRQRGPRRGANR